ncbi:class II aldolase/adducin family protein, partial [human gut metagenome]
MDIMEAKQLVIKAGIEVVEYGLIARTWGNISCRVDDKRFVITPSGRPYETLTPDEIVVVNIDDCSYEGDIKPSSEKGIHAEAYRLRPEVNFVIHTHQMQASVISALGMDINEVEPASAEIVGDNVPIAAYGLPGTGKLRKGVVEAIKRSDSKAVIMAHHGALCMGKDYDEAFKVAAELEKICETTVKNRYRLITGKVAETLGDVAEYIGTLFDSSAKEAPVFEPCNSERDGSVFNISAVDGDGS